MGAHERPDSVYTGALAHLTQTFRNSAQIWIKRQRPCDNDCATTTVRGETKKSRSSLEKEDRTDRVPSACGTRSMRIRRTVLYVATWPLYTVATKNKVCSNIPLGRQDRQYTGPSPAGRTRRFFISLAHRGCQPLDTAGKLPFSTLAG